jgi:hypothetical protein
VEGGSVILLVVGVVALSWLSWISIQSLLQARLIGSIVRMADEAPEPGRATAVHGRVRVTEKPRSGWLGDVLWFRREHQELRGSGKSRSWQTVSTEEETAKFRLEAGGREVWVVDPPTEVHGTRSATSHDEGGSGCATLGFGERPTRTVTTWLPVPERLTAAGRLEERGGVLGLVRDGKIGLYLSPDEPHAAAARERAKGVWGLVAVTVAVVLALWWWFSLRA